MKVITVKPLPQYTLQVTFDDGVYGIIDLKGFIGEGVFSSLVQQDLFDKVYANGSSIAWSEEMEIDGLAVYSEITGKTIEQINSKHYSAAD